MAKFVKILEEANPNTEEAAWKACTRLLKTLDLNIFGTKVYSIGAKYIKGKWCACLFEK